MNLCSVFCQGHLSSLSFHTFTQEHCRLAFTPTTGTVASDILRLDPVATPHSCHLSPLSRLSEVLSPIGFHSTTCLHFPHCFLAAPSVSFEVLIPEGWFLAWALCLLYFRWFYPPSRLYVFWSLNSRFSVQVSPDLVKSVTCGHLQKVLQGM
jgi:hypothetical protein